MLKCFQLSFMFWKILDVCLLFKQIVISNEIWLQKIFMGDEKCTILFF